MARQRKPLFTSNPEGSLSAFEGPDADTLDEIESEQREAEAPPLEFALETYLEQFLFDNWDGIDWGRPLEIWESDTGEIGHQLVTGMERWTSSAATRPTAH